MLELLLRLSTEVGPAAIWIASFCAAIVAVFVICIVIAFWAAMHASDPDVRDICYQLFRDLLELFPRRRRR